MRSLVLPLARGGRLQRSGGAVPISSGTGEQPGGILARPDSGRLLGRTRRLDGLHAALCHPAHRIRVWRRRSGRTHEPGRDPWPEARGGGHRRAGGMGRAHPVSRPAACLRPRAVAIMLFQHLVRHRSAPSAWAASQALAVPGISTAGRASLGASVSRRVGVICLTAFSPLLAALPVLANTRPSVTLFDAFYRSGALVFGGGHVVLPLLSQAFVSWWVNPDAFLAGYGAAQAVPGPLGYICRFSRGRGRPLAIPATSRELPWAWPVSSSPAS